jgi:hypothetical protein
MSYQVTTGQAAGDQYLFTNAVSGSVFSGAVHNFSPQTAFTVQVAVSGTPPGFIVNWYGSLDRQNFVALASGGGFNTST